MTKISPAAIAFYSGLMLIPYLPNVKKVTGKWMAIAFLIPFLLLLFNDIRILSPKSNYFTEQKLFNTYLKQKPVTLISDERIVKFHDLYFGFDLTSSKLKVLDWNSLDQDELLEQHTEIYILRNNDRLSFDTRNYGVQIPSFLDSIPDNWILKENEKLIFYKADKMQLLEWI